MNNTGVTGQFLNWPDEGIIENSKRKLAIICTLFQTLKTDFDNIDDSSGGSDVGM